MKFNKENLVVRAFHYDLVTENPQIKQDIQVAMRQIEFDNPEFQPTEDQGNFFEIMVPFEISPNPGFFQISGQITQVVQTIDYFGTAQELDQETLEMLSRPLIETIETLTYQVTSVALEKPVDLNFVSGTAAE